MNSIPGRLFYYGILEYKEQDMATVTDSLIQLNLECSECGFQWDISNRDELSVNEAILDAENEPCPKCEDEEL